MNETDLVYTGEGRFLIGIPADALSPLDIAVIANRRGKTEAQLRKELIESGLYRAAKPAKPDKETQDD